MWLAYYQHFLVDQNRSDIHTKLNNTVSTEHGAVVVLLRKGVYVFFFCSQKGGMLYERVSLQKL